MRSETVCSYLQWAGVPAPYLHPAFLDGMAWSWQDTWNRVAGGGKKGGGKGKPNTHHYEQQPQVIYTPAPVPQSALQQALPKRLDGYLEKQVQQAEAAEKR